MKIKFRDSLKNLNIPSNQISIRNDNLNNLTVIDINPNKYGTSAWSIATALSAMYYDYSITFDVTEGSNVVKKVTFMVESTKIIDI